MASALTQTAVTRHLMGAIAAMERAGHIVKAVRVLPDGTVEALTDAPMPVVASNDTDSDWADLAGETALPRA